MIQRTCSSLGVAAIEHSVTNVTTPTGVVTFDILLNWEDFQTRKASLYTLNEEQEEPQQEWKQKPKHEEEQNKKQKQQQNPKPKQEQKQEQNPKPEQEQGQEHTMYFHKGFTKRLRKIPILPDDW